MELKLAIICKQKSLLIYVFKNQPQNKYKIGIAYDGNNKK